MSALAGANVLVPEKVGAGVSLANGFHEISDLVGPGRVGALCLNSVVFCSISDLMHHCGACFCDQIHPKHAEYVIPQISIVESLNTLLKIL